MKGAAPTLMNEMTDSAACYRHRERLAVDKCISCGKYLNKVKREGRGGEGRGRGRREGTYH